MSPRKIVLLIVHCVACAKSKLTSSSIKWSSKCLLGSCRQNQAFPSIEMMPIRFDQQCSTAATSSDPQVLIMNLQRESGFPVNWDDAHWIWLATLSYSKKTEVASPWFLWSSKVGYHVRSIADGDGHAWLPRRLVARQWLDNSFIQLWSNYVWQQLSSKWSWFSSYQICSWSDCMHPLWPHEAS